MVHLDEWGNYETSKILCLALKAEIISSINAVMLTGLCQMNETDSLTLITAFEICELSFQISRLNFG